MNIRDKQYTTESGKDVKSTSQLSGQAKTTKAWNAKNEATQDTGKGPCPKGGGGMGGRNTNS